MARRIITFGDEGVSTPIGAIETYIEGVRFGERSVEAHDRLPSASGQVELGPDILTSLADQLVLADDRKRQDSDFILGALQGAIDHIQEREQ